MQNAARVGDLSQIPSDVHGCPACPHSGSGPATNGSPDVEINGMSALRVGDMGQHAACCGANLWQVSAGAATVLINGKPACRVGDAVVHCGGVGQIANGSPNVMIGGDTSEIFTGQLAFAAAESSELILVELYEVIKNKDNKEEIVPAKSRKQYINLDPEANGHKQEYGRKLCFKAQIIRKDGKKDGLAGQTLYWKIESRKSNRRELLHDLLSGFDVAGSDKQVKEVVTDDSGWTPDNVEYYLSRYADDEFTVSVSLKKDPEYKDKKSCTYKCWRRVLIEIDSMNSKIDDTDISDFKQLNRLTSYYGDNKLNVELVKSGKENIIESKRAIFGNPNSINNWIKQFRNDENETSKIPKIHIVLVERIGVNLAVIPEKKELKYKSSKPKYKFTISSKTETAKGIVYHILDLDNWLLSADCVQGNRAPVVLDAARFILNEIDGEYEVELNLDNMALDDRSEITINMSIIRYDELAGAAVGDSLIIGVGSLKNIDQRIAGCGALADFVFSTMVHEIGHYMGLAATKSPSGEKCGSTYVSVNGRHCEKTRSDNSRCVMYETSSIIRDSGGNCKISTEYCTDCLDAARGCDLSALDMSGAH